MIVRILLLAAAAAAALLPMSAAMVEGWYSAGVYLRMQAIVTPATNLVPVALLDVAAGLLLAAWTVRLVRRSRAQGGRAALVSLAGAVVTTAAALYLVFLCLWGLNYRRVPLEQKLEYDEARITREAAVRLAQAAVLGVNDAYDAAHASALDDLALAAASSDVQRALGAPRAAAPGVPKASLLGVYFRYAAIDGMTDPFFLEIIVNPELLAFERPFVLAHEWAHLAGYADEAEANFVAWLTCARGDAAARYSGWLAAYQHAWAALSPEERRALPRLAPGPRADLAAMAARYERSSPRVRVAARDVYDSYLRANRIEEGIESYGAVVRLMLGSRVEDGWRPRLRSR